MLILSIIAAVLAIVAGSFSVLIISKFSEMFDETSTVMPWATAIIVDSSGWIPGGIFFFLAALLVALVIAKKNRIAGIVAIMTFLFTVATAVVVPILLYSSLSDTIRELESSENSEEQSSSIDQLIKKKPNKSEQATPRKPSD